MKNIRVIIPFYLDVLIYKWSRSEAPKTQLIICYHYHTYQLIKMDFLVTTKQELAYLVSIAKVYKKCLKIWSCHLWTIYLTEVYNS